MAITINGSGTVTGISVGGLPDGIVDDGTLATDAVTAVKIADNAVDLAEMASGTDGQIITYDASGNPTAVGPGTDGQVLTSTGAGSPPAFETAGGGGKVLQVVQTHVITTSSQTFSSATITNITNLNATITPSATSSKILVSVRWYGESSDADNYNILFGINRGSTYVGSPTASGIRNYGITGLSQGYWNSDTTTTPDNANWEYLDSPNTTSATTYYGTFRTGATSGTLYNNTVVNDSNELHVETGTSTITLMEIGA